MSRETAPPGEAIPGLGLRLFKARSGLEGPGRKFPQTRAGAYIGRSGVTVGRWEAGVDTPGLMELVGLAKLYGVDPGELAFGSPEERAALLDAYLPPTPTGDDAREAVVEAARQPVAPAPRSSRPRNGTAGRRGHP